MRPAPLRRRMLAVRRETALQGGLTIDEVDMPVIAPNETLVRVAALSIGYDDVEHNLAVRTGVPRPGWDLAGTVEVAAKDRSGPKVGARVAGLVRSGAWGQFAAVPSNSIAEIPASVTFAQAAATPSAGLTALYGLEQGGLLTAKRVLVACAAGGVGLFAVQLARLAGAQVVAAIGTTGHDALLEEYGADRVVLGPVTGAAQFGPYHMALINAAADLDLTSALRLMRSYGLCVVYGTAQAPSAHVAEQGFVDNSIRLHGLALFDEPRADPASESLRRLLALVDERALHPHVEIEDRWTAINAVTERILGKGFVGRAVLHL